MKQIQVLDQQTIDKIAAGEVVERPASVVKELVENSIDAGASAITVEIKEGGTSFLRVTDNGKGIEGEEVPLAFLRHATSKIRVAEDLTSIASLGFRGEALSSISAVSKVEFITKTKEAEAATKYCIEGGVEKSLEEIGAPNGTTFLIRSLFYNTPARKKFLKSITTEAGYVADLMEKMALSHPEISFQFINQQKTKLHTSGNGNLKDVIYQIYGRDIANNLAEVKIEDGPLQFRGFIGKPVISRGNRTYETYFVNGRYVKSNIISKGIEEGYHSFLMQHKYPFTVLHIEVDSKEIDVNVHPTKMELRFSNQHEVYEKTMQVIKDTLTGKELIPKVEPPKPIELPKVESVKVEPQKQDLNYFMAEMKKRVEKQHQVEVVPEKTVSEKIIPEKVMEKPSYQAPKQEEQLTLFEKELLNPKTKSEIKIIGQLFETYWLVQFEDKFYMIDQHAAHEKVLYEKTMKGLKTREYTTQQLLTPWVLSLSMLEAELLNQYLDSFLKLGFEIEEFGGIEYMVRGVPGNLFGLQRQEQFMEMLDELSGLGTAGTPELILEKVASMSCKAAVKGNNRMNMMEAKELIEQLLELENPYHCPHGRPTIIAMTKQEIEKKFKRIV